MTCFNPLLFTRRPDTANARRLGPAAVLVVLAIWTVAGESPAAVGADARPGASGARAEPARRIVHSPRLLANNSNTERHVVTGICEARGIQEIAEILKRSDVEEMWAFLPRAHGSQECQWHEIGREEKSGSDNAYVHVDMAYFEQLMAGNTEIHLVHFHPLRFFDCAADPGCPREAPTGRAGAVDPRWITDLVFSMPGPSDIHFMMDVTSRFNRRYPGQGTIRHKVVTPYGVVDYGLTDKGLAKYDAERHARNEGRYIAWVVASRLADDSLEIIVKDHPGGIAAAVRGLAQSLNTEFLRVIHGASGSKVANGTETR